MSKTKPVDYFSICMKMVLDKDVGSKNNDDGNTFADNQLLLASKSAMALKLHEASLNGRHGWWDKDVCSIDDLLTMRDKALKENDHVSVLNFTAMIAMRESLNIDEA
ncbi:hypothetical protein VPHD85_0035 [Vibrio phage D85]